MKCTRPVYRLVETYSDWNWQDKNLHAQFIDWSKATAILEISLTARNDHGNVRLKFQLETIGRRVFLLAITYWCTLIVISWILLTFYYKFINPLKLKCKYKCLLWWFLRIMKVAITSEKKNSGFCNLAISPPSYPTRIMYQRKHLIVLVITNSRQSIIKY